MREVTNPREKPFIKNSEWKLSWITFCGCFILFHFIFFSRSLCVSFILPTCLAVSFFFSSRLLLSHYIYYNYSYTSAFLCFLFLLIVRSFNFIVSLVQWSYSSKRWLCVKFFTIINSAHAVWSKNASFLSNLTQLISLTREEKKAMRPKGGLY